MLNKENLHRSFLFIFLQGFVGGLFILSAFYYLLLFAVTRDPVHPFNQFGLYQPWMSLLIIGFGVQMGLFWMMKKGIRFSLQEKSDAKLAAGTGTAVSSMTMVACCAHHAVDLLPILGLSAAAVFLSEYQEQLLIFGVVTNLAGILLMLWFITGKPKPKIVLAFFNYKFKEKYMNSKYFFIILLLLAGAVIFGFSAKQKQANSTGRSTDQANNTTLSSLQPQSKTMGVVEVTLTPEVAETDKEMVFDLTMSNHSVDLNYNYTKIVTLLDDQGNEYKPSEWAGNTSGHHVEGKLIFSPIQTQTSSLAVRLDGVDDQTETFEWKL